MADPSSPVRSRQHQRQDPRAGRNVVEKAPDKPRMEPCCFTSIGRSCHFGVPLACCVQVGGQNTLKRVVDQVSKRVNCASRGWTPAPDGQQFEHTRACMGHNSKRYMRLPKNFFLPQSGQMMTVDSGRRRNAAPFLRFSVVQLRSISPEWCQFVSRTHGSVHLGAVPSISLWLPKVTFAILPCFRNPSQPFPTTAPRLPNLVIVIFPVSQPSQCCTKVSKLGPSVWGPSVSQWLPKVMLAIFPVSYRAQRKHTTQKLKRKRFSQVTSTLFQRPDVGMDRGG